LYYSGLTGSSSRQRRHSADDSVIIDLHEPTKMNNDLIKVDNLDELKEIISNQRKYIHQLQMRVRINTPDLLQSPTKEKLTEQVQVTI
jgi:hypothetical protein